MPDRRCAAHLRSSALSGFLPVRPGSRAEGGVAIPGLDGQAAGLGPARWSRRDDADVVQWRQARGQRRLRPHPPAGHGLPGQPQEGSARPGAAARAWDLLVSAGPVGEGAGDGGGPAGDLQQPVDVFQVGAHGSLGNAQAPGDLGVGVPGGDQVQQFPLPACELGDWVAAALGVAVGLVQVRAQHGEQVTLAAGEIRPGPADAHQP